MIFAPQSMSLGKSIYNIDSASLVAMNEMLMIIITKIHISGLAFFAGWLRYFPFDELLNTIAPFSPSCSVLSLIRCQHLLPARISGPSCKMNFWAQVKVVHSQIELAASMSPTIDLVILRDCERFEKHISDLPNRT